MTRVLERREKGGRKMKQAERKGRKEELLGGKDSKKGLLERGKGTKVGHRREGKMKRQKRKKRKERRERNDYGSQSEEVRVKEKGESMHGDMKKIKRRLREKGERGGARGPIDKTE